MAGSAPLLLTLQLQQQAPPRAILFKVRHEVTYQQGPSIVRAVSCVAKVEAPGARLQPPRMLRCALLHSPVAVVQSLCCRRGCCRTCSTKDVLAAQAGRRLESTLVPGQQRNARESSFSLRGHPPLHRCQMTCRIQLAKGPGPASGATLSSH